MSDDEVLFNIDTAIDDKTVCLDRASKSYVLEQGGRALLFVSGHSEDDSASAYLKDDEAVSLAIALIQATPDDDTQHSDLIKDPVRYACALIRAAGKR